MRVRVDKIDGRGVVHEGNLDTDWVLEGARHAFDVAPTEAHASIRLEPPGRDGGVDVVVDARATAPAECDRCGQPVVLRVEAHSELRYVPASSGVQVSEDEEGIELGADELDLGWYEAGSLVLTDVLSESFALASPSRVICEDVGACDERTASLLASAKPEASGHPAFSALKNLKN